MEDIVLRELQLKLLEAKIVYRHLPYFSKLDERELVLTGLKDYFGNFPEISPNWPGERAIYRIIKKEDGDLDKETKKIFKFQRRFKELIEETDLNRIKVRELTQKFLKDRNSQNYLSFVDYVFPIFITLRMEGYRYPGII